MLRTQVLVCFALIVASIASDPRPTVEEWKEEEAATKAKEDEAAAKKDKMAAVREVIKLLADLTAKVIAEGEEEAKSYNEFSCFCKDGQREKTKEIKEAKDSKATLAAEINKLADGRKEDDKIISGLEEDIKALEKEMKEAELLNDKELKVYTAEKEDLQFAIDSINSALKALKASRNADASLLQLQSAAKSLRTALAMADALGLGVDTMQGPTAAFLQEAPKVEMEDYKFHSDSVIETIEGLLKKFREKKFESDAAEVERVKEYDMLMQHKTDTMKAKNLELSETEKAKQEKTAKIALKSQELTTTSANLLDDQAYLDELFTICTNKAKTWDSRVKARADEVQALTAAGEIIENAVASSVHGSTIRFSQVGVSIGLAKVMARNEDAMDQIEAAAEDEEHAHVVPAFLQRRSVSRHEDPDAGRAEVVKLLRDKGSQLKSTVLTSLAMQIDKEKDPFKKVKTLIEELITRLQAQAAAEATQKGWCDKAMADAEQKKTNAALAIRNLNGNMANLEAQIDLLKEELANLEKEIEDLKDAQTKADQVRKEEKAQNEHSISQAKAGKKAVQEAIDILADFYKSNADKKVDLKLLQGPKDDAPDAGFKSGEAYTGDTAGAEGVLGMLEVVKSDFDRTIKETTKAELEAEQDYKSFTAETTASIKSKEESETAKKKEKSDADADHEADEESLKKKTDLLQTTIEELIELKKTCVDTGMSYAERVARRDEEIASLRKALCILSAYDAYGPNAAEYDQCSGPY